MLVERYRLDPLRYTYLNDKLGLDPAEAQTCSPIFRVRPGQPPMGIVCGADELPALREQSRDFASARSRFALPGELVELPGQDHFSILDELAHPSGAITAMVERLAGRG